MPRFSDLQRMLKTPNRLPETRFDRNSGEESLVVDERSHLSSARIVEKKLQELALFRIRPTTSGESCN